MFDALAALGHPIGADAPCLIIAEAGVNHNGDPDLARQLIDVAADSGADAVKFQTFQAQKVAAVEAEKADYQKASSAAGESQLDMLRRLELSPQNHRDLMAYAAERQVLFLSTPFDEDSADLLDELGLPLFKIPSGDLTNLPLLMHIARKGKPIILSTGMATLSEVDVAVRILWEYGCSDLAILHCVSNYPADPANSNLRAMCTMAHAFGVPVGWSDHTLGIEVSLAAVAMGASVIEKHFTLDRTLPGPDHAASLSPEELKALVAGIRTVESALGNGRKVPAPSENATAKVARRSLYFRTALDADHRIEADDLIALRPEGGIPPALMPQIVGRRLKAGVADGSRVEWANLS
jgi:N,N'-diacetyllegionaminate synthase